jgi:hypothetical protein
MEEHTTSSILGLLALADAFFNLMFKSPMVCHPIPADMEKVKEWEDTLPGGNHLPKGMNPATSLRPRNSAPATAGGRNKEFEQNSPHFDKNLPFFCVSAIRLRLYKLLAFIGRKQRTGSQNRRERFAIVIIK